eukprot:CAMPEP_0202051180 /NCGR_PEP_ID=MMETSP0963-20130614/4465_1 /ASSEMBLY_ACC=CAM_ASM_000494 /TAXON_ID=4773 /ORGANISM="Schizochytrium aggregatum, Strain ATCC28209" /LENGTH=241 /DNA_ID=CAMNT_0048616325 /DNA_START=12 /DNA_END=737 /DNA_ORIENTATION=-
MDTNEAARALFFLQTSPVVAPAHAARFRLDAAPRIDLPRQTFQPTEERVRSLRLQRNTNLYSKASSDSDSDNVEEAKGDIEETQPGQALLALLNLNRVYAANQPADQFDNDMDSDGAESATSAGSAPTGAGSVASMGSPTSVAMALECMGRDRAYSMTTVEKRFSSDAMSISQPQGKIGHYSREERRRLIDRFLKKRHRRIWRKRVKYDVRKSFADSRLRVKGRFVRKEMEELLREVLAFS